MTKSQIIDYIMYTPTNTNESVLSTYLGEGDWSALYKYIKQTPHNMNRSVLEALIGKDPTYAVVGTAIVGQSVVG